MSRSPTLPEVLRNAFSSQLEGIELSLPGRIERYDASTQQIDAQVLIKKAHEDEEGNQVVERVPVICNVPVLFPSGGGFRLTLPLAVGDPVTLIFSASSLDKWSAQGGEVDPMNTNRFSLADCFAFPGGRDFAHPLASAPTSSMSIGKDGGPTIEITASQIQAGGTSQLATKADIDALASYINGTLAFATTCPAGAGSTTPGATSPPPTASGTTTLRGG